MVSVQNQFDYEDEWFENDVYGVVLKVLSEGLRWRRREKKACCHNMSCFVNQDKKDVYEHYDSA